MAPAALRMKKTLVVDDSLTIRRMVIASLRDVCTGGFEEAATGLEALEQLSLRSIGLIILDLNMPDMHGLEVLRFVRSHQAYSQIPIVVLTTRGDEASRSAVMAAGASIYLTKPFVPHVLAGHVKALVEATLPDLTGAGEGDPRV
jgi:two-component system, chemotaxis family, chemotaxis protein CheY